MGPGFFLRKCKLVPLQYFLRSLGSNNGRLFTVSCFQYFQLVDLNHSDKSSIWTSEKLRCKIFRRVASLKLWLNFVIRSFYVYTVLRYFQDLIWKVKSAFVRSKATDTKTGYFFTWVFGMVVRGSGCPAPSPPPSPWPLSPPHIRRARSCRNKSGWWLLSRGEWPPRRWLALPILLLLL